MGNLFRLLNFQQVPAALKLPYSIYTACALCHKHNQQIVHLPWRKGIAFDPQQIRLLGATSRSGRKLKVGVGLKQGQRPSRQTSTWQGCIEKSTKTSTAALSFELGTLTNAPPDSRSCPVPHFGDACRPPSGQMRLRLHLDRSMSCASKILVALVGKSTALPYRAPVPISRQNAVRLTDCLLTQ
jgi:hypothetical protein